jgi:two-component system response regulator YesN
MWKLMIADDEPKIRRGLSRVLPWSDWNIELAGEAEDGLQALETAAAVRPDILFVDICMPHLSGLEFIERLKQEMDNCIIIIITGHDEFEYARRAVKLKVFEYILKPVMKDELIQVVRRAVAALEEKKSHADHLSWVSRQLTSNSRVLRDRFLLQLIQGSARPEDLAQNLERFGLSLVPPVRMALFRVIQSIDMGAEKRHWNKELLEFAVKNIIEEVVSQWESAVVFSDERSHIAVLAPAVPQAEWEAASMQIHDLIERMLGKMVFSADEVLEREVQHCSAVYSRLVVEISVRNSQSPVVTLARKYVEAYYAKPDLTLQEVADNAKISPTYLSKLLKKETGMSFIDYLSEVRVQKAVTLMTDPAYKMYEIAEKVGYSSQHYFSSAFKKVSGVSPNLYRKGVRK